MQAIKLGQVEMLMGENGSRTPFSSTLIIKGKSHSALLDCGAGKKAFEYIKETNHVAEIYLTHHHLDHTWGAHLFPEAKVYINPLDENKAADIRELVIAQGFPAVMSERELDTLVGHQKRHRLPGEEGNFDREVRADGTYRYGTEIDVAGTRMVMVFAPGHTEGYCCPYFPDIGLFYAGDFDLTSFGPFYCDADGDIDLFMASAKKTLDYDAKYYATAHQKGAMLKSEYEKALMVYLEIIERRDEKIKAYVKSGKPPEGLLSEGIFYYEHQTRWNPFYMKSEKVGIAKHLKRLIKQGEPFAEYYHAFLASLDIREEYLEYRTVKQETQRPFRTMEG